MLVLKKEIRRCTVTEEEESKIDLLPKIRCIESIEYSKAF